MSDINTISTVQNVKPTMFSRLIYISYYYLLNFPHSASSVTYIRRCWNVLGLTNFLKSNQITKHIFFISSLTFQHTFIISLFSAFIYKQMYKRNSNYCMSCLTVNRPIINSLSYIYIMGVCTQMFALIIKKIWKSIW